MTCYFLSYALVSWKGIYIIIHEDGSYKSKGAYVKNLDLLDYNLQIMSTGLIEYLITEKGSQKIILNLQEWNERAMKSYEKSGFKKVKLLPKQELHEGELKDCWLMEYNIRHIDLP